MRDYMRILGAGALTGVLLSAGCESASDVELIGIDAFAELTGQVVLDANGSGEIDAGDEPVENAVVVLLPPGGSSVLRSETTDTVGVFRMEEIPAGAYRVAIDSEVLGDSLELSEESVGGLELVLENGDTTLVRLGVTLPSLDLESVLEAEPGRRIFTTGIALNARQAFGDGVVHLQGEDGFLRLLDVERADLAAGDSVRVVGRIVRDNGRPALQDVTPFVLVQGAAIPIPEDVTTAVAAGADEARLDGALVRLQEAEILDTTTVAGNFHATIDDGSGPVTVVLRSFLQLPTTEVRPDTIVRVRRLTGLLSPMSDGTGGVTWQVLPRGLPDVQLENKLVDLSVGQVVTPATASQGDTVVVRVILSNAGPLDATGVEVSDTIPGVFALASSEATRGAYDVVNHLWTLGTVPAGAVDTLSLRLTVTPDTAGVFSNVARVGRLEREADVALGNNAAAAFITLVTPAPGG